MINTDMRTYDYFTYDKTNAYNQPILSDDIKGSVKIAIYETSTSIQDNINYKEAQYIGLTKEGGITDRYVIQYGEIRLKVLYVNARGRLNQVFMVKL